MEIRERLMAYVMDMSMVLLEKFIDRSTLEGMTLKDLEHLAVSLDEIYWNS